MEKEICCDTWAGDEIDNTYRMLFGHHPHCPVLRDVPKLLDKERFSKNLNLVYEIWEKKSKEKYELDTKAWP